MWRLLFASRSAAGLTRHVIARYVEEQAVRVAAASGADGFVLDMEHAWARRDARSRA